MDFISQLLLSPGNHRRDNMGQIRRRPFFILMMSLKQFDKLKTSAQFIFIQSFSLFIRRQWRLAKTRSEHAKQHTRDLLAPAKLS